MGTRVLGWERCSRYNGGDGIGRTKVGTGANVLVVVDGNGLPIGVHVDSAQPHALRLVEPTWQTIAVPRTRGRSKTRPHAVVADNADDRAAVRAKLRRCGIKSTIPTVERCKRQTPKRGFPIGTGAG